MYRKKQLTAIELVESFKNYASNHLSRNDREICDKLIASDMNEHQMDDHISEYILLKGNKKKLDIDAAEQLAMQISNYITVHRGLLLSYSATTDNVFDIPEKFYRPIPNEIGMALVAVPQLKLIIKTSTVPGKAWYGEQRMKSGSLLSIDVFKYTNKWIILYKGSFIDTKYPRFNIVCPIADECSYYNESALMFDAGEGVSDIFYTKCKMSRNRSHLCMIEMTNIDEYGIGLLGFHALVMMCYDRWQKRPLIVGTKKNETYIDMGVAALIAKIPQWQHTSVGFVEIPLRNYPQFTKQARARGYLIDNRSSPCEHVRRGHMRTLKDGRKVYVRSSIINKGGEKVIYKVSK